MPPIQLEIVVFSNPFMVFYKTLNECVAIAGAKSESASSQEIAKH